LNEIANAFWLEHRPFEARTRSVEKQAVDQSKRSNRIFRAPTIRAQPIDESGKLQWPLWSGAGPADHPAGSKINA
jgi:hypothetical protein